MKIIRPAISPDMNTISRAELREFVSKELSGKLSKDYCFHMADFGYYLPSYEYAEEIIKGSKIKEMTGSVGNVRGQRFDCDDFSLLLKARFAHAAYREPETYENLAHCFGIVWGMLPFPFSHSLNWMVTSEENGDKKFHFVEPQTQTIISSPDDYKNYRYIYLLLV